MKLLLRAVDLPAQNKEMLKRNSLMGKEDSFTFLSLVLAVGLVIRERVIVLQ